MAETFSQQFCSMAMCGAGGKIVAGRRFRNCLVQVVDGELVIVIAPSRLAAKMPCPEIKIVTPPTVRKAGTAVVLHMPLSPLFAVEFDGVYRRQQAYAKRADRKSGPRLLASSLWHLVSDLSALTSLPESMRLGRELAREFTAALLADGAIDRTAASAEPPHPVDSGPPGSARRRSEGFEPSAAVPVERSSHHYIDLARAQLLAGQRGKALHSLQTADKLAPQHTRNHPMARETVSGLARVHARVPESLRSMARRMGVAV